MRRLILLFLLGTSPLAAAQDAPAPNLASEGSGIQGGVARYVFAQRLHIYGRANKDPLTLLNAARLAASVTLIDTPRGTQTEGETAQDSPFAAPTAAQMLDAATQLAAGDEALIDLIDATRREAGFAPTTTAVSSQATLGVAATESFTIPFFGATLAEIAIVGDGQTNLDLHVTDDAGNPICQDIGPSDTAYCDFFPAQNGRFQITVQNVGASTSSFLLLTN